MANDRLYQLPVEAVVSPTDTKAQVSQEPVEVVVAPTDTKARVSQFVVEAIVANTDSEIRVTQQTVEAITQNANPELRVTQQAIEAVTQATSPELRVTQQAVEVVYRLAGSAALALDYEIKAASTQVNQDLSLDYTVYNAVSSDLSVDYGIYAEVNASLSLDYPIAGTVSRDLAVDYPVRSLVSSDTALDYQVYELVGADLDLGYAVTGAPVTVQAVAITLTASAVAPSMEQALTVVSLSATTTAVAPSTANVIPAPSLTATTSVPAPSVVIDVTVEAVPLLISLTASGTPSRAVLAEPLVITVTEVAPQTRMGVTAVPFSVSATSAPPAVVTDIVHYLTISMVADTSFPTPTVPNNITMTAVPLVITLSARAIAGPSIVVVPATADTNFQAPTLSKTVHAVPLWISMFLPSGVTPVDVYAEPIVLNLSGPAPSVQKKLTVVPFIADTNAQAPVIDNTSIPPLFAGISMPAPSIIRDIALDMPPLVLSTGVRLRGVSSQFNQGAWSYIVNEEELNDGTRFRTVVPDIQDSSAYEVILAQIDGDFPVYVRIQPMERVLTFLISMVPCPWSQYQERLSILQELFKPGVLRTLQWRARGAATVSTFTPAEPEYGGTENVALVEYIDDWKGKQAARGHSAGFEAPAYDDSSWATMTGPFGTPGYCNYSYSSTWSTNTDLCIRKVVNVPAGTQNMALSFGIDNDCEIFWNGVQLIRQTHEGCAQPFDFTIPITSWNVGDNVLAVRAIDRGTLAYFGGALLATVPTSTDLDPAPEVQFVTKNMMIDPKKRLVTVACVVPNGIQATVSQ